MVASDIWRQVPRPVRGIMTARMRTTEQGAQTSLYCATAPEVAGQTGLFYDDCSEREASSGGHREPRQDPLGTQRGLDRLLTAGRPDGLPAAPDRPEHRRQARSRPDFGAIRGRILITELSGGPRLR